jgi:hypothetical protein
MKNIRTTFSLVLLAVLFQSTQLFGQYTWPVPEDVSNYNCASAFPVTDIAATKMNLSNLVDNYGYFYFSVTVSDTNDCDFEFMVNKRCDMRIYGPFANSTLEACGAIDNNQVASLGWTGETLVDPYSSHPFAGYYSLPFNQTAFGTYIVRVGVFNGASIADPSNIYQPYVFIYTENTDFGSCFSNHQTIIPCEDCITSFRPTPGHYMVSAWVKEDFSGNQPLSYLNSSIVISFTGSSETFILLPKGQIIDGWQRIEAEIIIPDGATDIHIDLVASSTIDCYFDDIRFVPYNGSMMSYVYDPRNLRLMAQLDERNYATFYEYDEEGKLIRVKKETERGIMTIQENRDNIVKKPGE